MSDRVKTVLVIGGTGFLGGAVARAARHAGHHVTILTRGQTAPPEPGSGHLVADRHSDLSVLHNRTFDLVVDTCAYVPSAVASLLSALKDQIGIYALVSSISAYDDFSTPQMTEAGAASSISAVELQRFEALPPADRSNAAVLGQAYGPLKRACEELAIARLGAKALILRAGLLVGPHDYTDRFTFWVRRIDQGSRVPLGGDPHLPVQFIDVRDAANFIVEAGGSDIGGIFNLTGPPMTRAALFDMCAKVSGSSVTFTWLPDQAFADAGLKPWSDVPLWIPAARLDRAHFLNVSVANALAAGLRIRPLAETVSDTLAWDRGRQPMLLNAGWSAAQEARLLGAA